MQEKNGRQVIQIQLDNMENYKFYHELTTKQGYTPPDLTEPKNYTIPTRKTDTLEILRPYKKGDVKFFDIRLPVLGQTLIDDRLRGKKTLEYQLPVNANRTAKKGDMVGFEVENKFYNDSLLLFHLQDLNATPTTIEPKPIFTGSEIWDSPAAEMAAIKYIVDDLHSTGEYFKATMKDPYVQTGPYAGKTVPQIFAAATEKDVINFLNYVLSLGRQFLGFEFKVAESYGDWIKAGQPKGDYKNLKVLMEYDKWVKMVPLVIDLDKGTINKVPIAQALNNFTTLYPWYNDEEELSDENKNGPTYDYDHLGNGLTYFKKVKALKIYLVNHEAVIFSKLKEASKKEVDKKLGKPAKIKDGHAFYTMPFGSIEFMMDDFYDATTCIYLYPTKPATVVPAESD